METADPAIASLDAIAEEHEALANLYAQILDALQVAPGQLLPAIALLDDLVERLVEHFAHEEQSGYYSHVVEMAPWRASTVNELKRQHAVFLRLIVRIARVARLADKSKFWSEAVREEFAEFLRRIVEHEGQENRLVQEVYILDVAAADSSSVRRNLGSFGLASERQKMTAVLLWQSDVR
jgi:hemerythrin